MDTSSVGQFIYVNRDNVMRFITTNSMLEKENVIESIFFIGRMLGAVLLTFIAMTLLQMTLSLLINGAISAIVIIAMYVFSAFYKSEYMPGNYIMFSRMDEFLVNGISEGSVVAGSLFIVSICLITGYVVFRKKDIL